jgi:hypothetical protein
MVAAAES